MGENNPVSQPVVVADAGPLIHLDELGGIELLADFKQVWVPDAIWCEVEHHRPQALQRLSSVLIRKEAPNHTPVIDALASMYTLHMGEREALTWCLSQHSLLLTDDTAARLAAKSLGLEAHGTIGLLIRAVRRKLHTKNEVLQLLSDIPHRTTLHIRPSFLAEIIREMESKL